MKVSIIAVFFLLNASLISSVPSTIVQLFEWNWNSVAKECEFLAASGYGWAQVSPPQETPYGSEWYLGYQPTSYIINGRRGNRTEFINMVATCEKHGVKILVDAVINHMAGSRSGSNSDGKYWNHYNYPSVPWVESDFHYPHCRINGWIYEKVLWNCELVGLADLNTTFPHVQRRLADYLIDLQSMGVAGMRLDAAKHMNPKEVLAILKMLPKPFEYITQECIYDSTSEVTPNQYIDIGALIVYPIGFILKETLKYGQHGGLAGLVKKPFGPEHYGTASFQPHDKANSFVTCHDTERNGGMLSWRDGHYYTLATVFYLAQNYSTPTIYSSYNWTDTSAGPPQDYKGKAYDVECGKNGWRCEHRWPAFANMIMFNNLTRGTDMNSQVTNSSNQVGWGRGNLGFVLINNVNRDWTGTWKTKLPQGVYCDLIHAKNPSNLNCSASTVTVDAEGNLSATVKANDALAFVVQSSVPKMTLFLEKESIKRTSMKLSN